VHTGGHAPKTEQTLEHTKIMHVGRGDASALLTGDRKVPNGGEKEDPEKINQGWFPGGGPSSHASRPTSSGGGTSSVSSDRGSEISGRRRKKLYLGS